MAKTIHAKRPFLFLLKMTATPLPHTRCLEASNKVQYANQAICFSTLLTTGELICIKKGVSGYYRSDWSTDDPEENARLADFNNERLGVTTAQRKAMECGSMHDWSCSWADPAAYEQKAQTAPEKGQQMLQ